LSAWTLDIAELAVYFSSIGIKQSTSSRKFEQCDNHHGIQQLSTLRASKGATHLCALPDKNAEYLSARRVGFRDHRKASSRPNNQFHPSDLRGKYRPSSLRSAGLRPRTPFETLSRRYFYLSDPTDLGSHSNIAGSVDICRWCHLKC
jgi:hypothetical protein